LLAALTEAEISAYVVTSKRYSMSEITLEQVGLEDNAELLVTMEDTKAHKPDPAPLLLALKRARTKPEDAVYVGDAVFDIQAAHAAGLPAIAVTWGAGTRTALEAAAPDFICNTAEELQKLLLG
jgi:pyrophosphatase PpaX